MNYGMWGKSLERGEQRLERTALWIEHVVRKTENVE